MAVAITLELERYYMQAQHESFQVFTRLREEAAARAAQAEEDRESAVSLAEELQAANEELIAQQEELHQLNEQLRNHSQDVEEEVTRRTAELRAAVEQLRDVDRYKDEFLSIISHELRTPLNFIMGFASVLDDEIQGPLNEAQHQALGKILAGTDRMLLLVDDLLDFARMQAGTFQLSMEPSQYPLLVDEVIATMRPLADRKQLRLEAEVAIGVAPWLDEQRITQVLINLVGNAIKFTDQGSVRIRAFERDGMIVTQVVDSGCGISAEDQPKLFTRFQQLDMSATRKAGGTGLGLAICKALIESHGGEIGVESQPGAGSTFWFTLPLRRE